MPAWFANMPPVSCVASAPSGRGEGKRLLKTYELANSHNVTGPYDIFARCWMSYVQAHFDSRLFRLTFTVTFALRIGKIGKRKALPILVAWHLHMRAGARGSLAT